MICNNNYLADILRVCEIKDLIWVMMRFQNPLVYNISKDLSSVMLRISTTQNHQQQIKNAKTQHQQQN